MVCVKNITPSQHRQVLALYSSSSGMPDKKKPKKNPALAGKRGARGPGTADTTKRDVTKKKPNSKKAANAKAKEAEAKAKENQSEEEEEEQTEEEEEEQTEEEEEEEPRRTGRIRRKPDRLEGYENDSFYENSSSGTSSSDSDID